MGFRAPDIYTIIPFEVLSVFLFISFIYDIMTEK